ncbi:hypothetical protein V6N12_059120 [Hibiscus sabdariffa]|uniref:hAT-like transposase RNase-H fold domain-containing protein n=1 Tax=Hibiscus sabdariffa TaxID=183260 RepID=A0ABR2EWZ9_9ROSI
MTTYPHGLTSHAVTQFCPLASTSWLATSPIPAFPHSLSQFLVFLLRDMSSEPQSSSTPVGVSRVEELFVNVDDNLNEEDECNVEASEPLLDTTTKEAESTSHLKRHIDGCIKKSRFLKQQQALNFLPSESSTGTDQSGFVSALHDGKVDMLKMREAMAHWIIMHEHPFSIVEEEGFNLMMKRGMPQWTSVSRVTMRSDSFKVYEFEKLKLKALLKKVDRISLTTDLWKSKPQKIEYMVLTAHFVDLDWKLQKRVLNFVHFPPLRKEANIVDCILKCLKEWEIEDKVFTISVDNASANDSLQHGLQQVQDIIEKVHDTVDFLNASDARLKRFGSEYPTANLFLGEAQRIKVLLDVKSESLDDFVKSMVANMKEKFTKYWGECNLLMAIGSVMDPRLKMRAVEIAFPKMFPSDLVRENIGKVKDIMYQLFEEYLRIYSSTCNVEESGECAFPINAHGGDVTSSGAIYGIMVYENVVSTIILNFV